MPRSPSLNDQLDELRRILSEDSPNARMSKLSTLRKGIETILACRATNEELKNENEVLTSGEFKRLNISIKVSQESCNQPSPGPVIWTGVISGQDQTITIPLKTRVQAGNGKTEPHSNCAIKKEMLESLRLMSVSDVEVSDCK